MSQRLCLLIDAGNTRIKWVLWAVTAVTHRQPPVWRARGDCPTGQPEALAEQWTQVLTPVPASSGAPGRPPIIDIGVVCSVAGESVNSGIERAFQAVFQGACESAAAVASDAAGSAAVNAAFNPDAPPALPPSPPLHRFQSRAQMGPLANGYDNPSQLGADRLAAALGALARGQGDALVVCAGTATTVDLLHAAGKGGARFSGGIILPGLDLMQRALATQTAQLPDARGDWQTLPTNTDDAITSGCLNAQIGAIERMRAQLPAAAPCLLAGGAAKRLLPHLAPPVIDAPDLVLEGLAAAILHGFQP